MSRCAICKFMLKADEETMRCPECSAVYHVICWQTIGGCAVYGCSAAAQPDTKVETQVVGKGWGDEKQCPNCQRPIAASLLVCNCGVRFPWAEPMSRREYVEWLDAERKRGEKRNVLVFLFVVSLFALPAPMAGAAAGAFAYTNRDDLAGEYGAFLALGYGTAALGLVYLLILIALF